MAAGFLAAAPSFESLSLSESELESFFTDAFATGLAGVAFAAAGLAGVALVVFDFSSSELLSSDELLSFLVGVALTIGFEATGFAAGFSSSELLSPELLLSFFAGFAGAVLAGDLLTTACFFAGFSSSELLSSESDDAALMTGILLELFAKNATTSSSFGESFGKTGY